MNRDRKEQLVAEMRQFFFSASLVVVVRQTGLTVAEIFDLRQRMRAAGARFRVTKNSLARLALKGSQFEYLDAQFSGSTGIAVSGDLIAAARIAVAFAKSSGGKFDVLAAGLNGHLLEADAVRALASLPSLDILRGRVIGILQVPPAKIVGVLQEPAAQLVRVLDAYASSFSSQ